MKLEETPKPTNTQITQENKHENRDISIPPQGHSFSTAVKETEESKRPDEVLQRLLVKMKSNFKGQRMKKLIEHLERKASDREKKVRKVVWKTSNVEEKAGK